MQKSESKGMPNSSNSKLLKKSVLSGNSKPVRTNDDNKASSYDRDSKSMSTYRQNEIFFS